MVSLVLAFVVNVVFGNWVHNNTSHNKSSLYTKTAQTEHVLIFLLATTITEHPLPNLMGHFAVGSWPRFVIMKSLNQRAKTKKQKTKQSTVMLLLYQNFICKVSFSIRINTMRHISLVFFSFYLFDWLRRGALLNLP